MRKSVATKKANQKREAQKKGRQPQTARYLVICAVSGQFGATIPKLSKLDYP